jgi:hypothetical protein
MLSVGFSVLHLIRLPAVGLPKTRAFAIIKSRPVDTEPGEGKAHRQNTDSGGTNERILGRHSNFTLVIISLLITAGCASSDPQAEAARETAEARNLTEKARIAAEEMITDKVIGPDVRALLAKSKGVFIAPDSYAPRSSSAAGGA